MGIYVSIIKTPLDIFKCGVFSYRIANPVDLVCVYWCSFGAIGMERMDFVLLVDSFYSIS